MKLNQTGNTARWTAAAAASAMLMVSLSDPARADEAARDRLLRLERQLAEERARSAANEAALRALQDRIGGAARLRDGADAGGPDGAADDDRVRKIVRTMLSDKTTSDDLRKNFGGLEAGFRKPGDYQRSSFFIRSGEEFELNINGRMQLRCNFTQFDPRDRRNGIPIPPSKAGTNPNLLNFDDRSDLSVGRFRLNFQGHLYSKNLTYRLEIDSSTRSNDAVGLFRAWVNWNALGGNSDAPAALRDALQFRFGQEHTPFGLIRSPGDLFTEASLAQQTVDVSPPTTFFTPNRNLQLDVHGIVGGVREGLPADRPGTKGLFEYHVTVSNGWQSAGRRYGYENDTAAGLPTTAREVDKLPTLSGRLMFEVLKGRYVGQDGKDHYLFGSQAGDLEHHETPALAIGGSFGWFRVRGQDRPQNNPALGAFYRPPAPTSFDDAFSDVYTAGADAAFKWRGFNLQGELYYQKILAFTNAAAANTTQSQDIFGWYVQGGCFVIPHELEPYYQFSGVQAGRTPAGGAFTAANSPLQGTNAPFNHNHVFGVNWYPFHSQNVKLTLEGAILVNNPVPGSREGWDSASRETRYQFRTQVQVAF